MSRGRYWLPALLEESPGAPLQIFWKESQAAENIQIITYKYTRKNLLQQ